MLLREKLRQYDLEIVNFMVGAVVLTFELAAARIITPYIGNTMYTWTSIIGVILAALAAGYSLGGRRADSRKDKKDIIRLIVGAAIWFMLLNLVKDGVLTSISRNNWPMQLQALLASLLLFALPTFLLGAVSPYLTRLRLENLKTSGQRVARMSAWGTAGSLFGTFLAGYVLFGYVGTNTVICLLSTVLILVTFILSYAAYVPQRILLLVVAVLSTGYAGAIPVAGLVVDTDTRYSRIIIRDININNRVIRVLQTDGHYCQSGIYLDGNGLAFGYTRMLELGARTQPEISNLLIIGGGAYTLPSHMARLLPEATIDTVEIDDGLQKLSEQYFNFTPTGNLRIFNQDGRAYLNRNSTAYDVIMIDAYASVVPPYQLVTKEAVAEMHRSLKPGGLTAANVISPRNGEPLLNLVKTYKTIFAHVAVMSTLPQLADTKNQNLILLAANKPIAKEDILSVVRTSEEKMAAEALFTPDAMSSMVMTDDYAPIERYSVDNL